MNNKTGMFLIFLGIDVVILSLLMGLLSIPDVSQFLPNPYENYFEIKEFTLLFVILENDGNRVKIPQWYVFIFYIIQSISMNQLSSKESYWRKAQENKKELYPDDKPLDRKRKMSPMMRDRIIIFIIICFIQFMIVQFEGKKLFEVIILTSQQIFLPLTMVFLMFVNSKHWVIVLLNLLFYCSFIII